MMKLRQKISGGFRSLEGATDFAVIRSFFSTAKKQGWNIINGLTWKNCSRAAGPLTNSSGSTSSCVRPAWSRRTSKSG